MNDELDQAVADIAAAATPDDVADARNRALDAIDNAVNDAVDRLIGDGS